jgi:hypothetical protein
VDREPRSRVLGVSVMEGRRASAPPRPGPRGIARRHWSTLDGLVSPTIEALTFDVLDDLLLAHERGRVPTVRLAPGPCLGSIIELLRFSQEHDGALPYRASDETAAIHRAYETRRPVYLDGESTGFVTARRAQYKGGDAHWTAFQLAMHKALLAATFPSLFARGLVGAMDEMQSNISDHSGAIDTGLIAYRVAADRVEWVVADGGIGVLNSLKSGAFPSLGDSGEALKIALTDGRSRFGTAAGRGYGFRELFKALSARHGSLRFRSDDHALTIAGVSPSLNRARLQQRAQVSGFTVTVICTKPAVAQQR